MTKDESYLRVCIDAAVPFAAMRAAERRSEKGVWGNLQQRAAPRAITAP